MIVVIGWLEFVDAVTGARGAAALAQIASERFEKGATDWPVGMPGFLFPACIFREPLARPLKRPLPQTASERFDPIRIRRGAPTQSVP